MASTPSNDSTISTSGQPPQLSPPQEETNSSDVKPVVEIWFSDAQSGVCEMLLGEKLAELSDKLTSLLTDLSKRENIQDIVRCCLDIECLLSKPYPPQESTVDIGEVISIQMLASCVLGEYVNAKFVWQRNALTHANKEVSAVYELVKALLTSELATFYEKAQNTSWSEKVGAFIPVLVEQVRLTQFSLLSGMYTKVSAANVAKHLGLSKEETIRKCVEFGWRRAGQDTNDMETTEDDILVVSKPKHSNSKQFSYATIESLANRVVMLEKKMFVNVGSVLSREAKGATGEKTTVGASGNQQQA